MNREILFRGKRMDNGEWVEGFYCRAFRWTGDKEPQPAIQESDCFAVRRIEPSTRGEFTGLTDKNGKRIFEGDIIEGDLEDPLDLGAKWSGVVTWGRFGWCLTNAYGSEPMDENDLKEGTVIGNIHDNPELLERGRAD